MFVYVMSYFAAGSYLIIEFAVVAVFIIHLFAVLFSLQKIPAFMDIYDL